jgi:hypothetical protein
MLRFDATECGSNVKDGSVVCGASNSKDKAAEWHSLIFSRETDNDDPDDWGPYFELDDQSQGFYTRSARVQFIGSLLKISVVPPAAQRFGHRTIVGELKRCPASQIAKLKKGLRMIFRDSPDRLRDG